MFLKNLILKKSAGANKACKITQHAKSKSTTKSFSWTAELFKWNIQDVDLDYSIYSQQLSSLCPMLAYVANNMDPREQSDQG